MKKLKRLVAALLLVAITIVPNVAYAATGKVTTINMTNLYNAYNSTKKTWNELKTAKHRLMGSFVAYCLQHKATVPNSQTYNLTDVMDNYSSKVRTGLQIIVENGYPFETGGLSAAQAEYATANAIRFWMTECGDDQFYNMTNLGSFSASQLRSLAAAGTITKKIQVRDAAYIPALQFSVELLIKARAQVLMEHRVDLSASSISAARSGDVFTGSTTVTTVNLHGGYRLDQSALPSGSTVSGYTGKGGDVLTISIPASASTANKTYTLTLTGRDDRVRSNMQVFCHNTDQAYQRVLCVRTGSDWYVDCCTSTLTVTTGDYEAPRPDLTITSLTSDAASYEAGGIMTITATVKNQGSAAVGSSDLSLSGSGIATQRQSIGALAVGASKQLTFSVPAPDAAQTLTLTAFADCDEVVAESDEDNNTRSLSVSVTAPAVYPDLIVSSVTPTRSSYETGMTGVVHAVVTNQGEQDAGAFLVTMVNGEETWSSQISSLAAGASKTLMFPFSTPSEPQTIVITVTADSKDAIVESNESNNSNSTTVEIVEPQLPDLTITAFTSNAASYETGKTMSFTVTVKNQGTAASGSAYLSLSGNGISTYKQSIGALAVGGTKQLTFSIPVPSSAQTLTLTAFADCDEVVAESNEGNNTKSLSVRITEPQLPDLTITAFTAGAASYETGKTMTFSVTVKNQGTAASGSAYLSLSGNDISTYRQSIGALAMGGTKQLTFSIPAPSSAQTLTLTAFADCDEAVSESNEDNNTKSLSVSIVESQLPDLTITAFTAGAASYETGMTMTFSVTVKNQGTAASGSAYLSLSGNGISTYKQSIGALAVGGTKQLTFSIPVPSSAQTLTLTAFADCDEVVAESNEGNNTKSLSVRITEPQLPDLTITSFTAGAASYETGKTMSFTVTVKNQGTAASGSANLSLSGNGISTTKQSIGTLAVGGTKQLTFSVPAPDTAQALTLTAFADCDEVVSESNEDNNTRSVTVEIVKPLLPDLTVTSVTPAKASYRAGETVTISTTIKNQGEADTGSFVVRLAPSGGSVQTRTVSGLKVGESTTLTWTFTAPVLSETEVWIITVTADSTGVIAESDESNNSASGSVTILGEKPDLCITSLTPDADSYAPGETITFTAVVKNNGVIACPESQIRFSGAEITSQTKPLSRIPAGGSVSISFALTAPGIVGEKTYTVTAMADPNNAVEESDESNNSRSSSFTVYNPLPDLTVTRIQSNKNEYADGETGTVTVTVSNQGGKDVANAKLKLAIGDFHSEVKQTGAIASGSSVRISFTFTAPEVLERREVMVTATADPTNEIVESNEVNNTLTSSLAIKPVLPDLGITNTNATNWYAGKDVVITATVVNYTSQAVPSVTVRLTIGANRYEEAIPLPGSGSNLAVFRVTLPRQTGATPIRFIVDPYNALPEENEGNNSYDRTIQIVNAPSGAVIDPDSAELEAHYASSGLLPLPGTENSDYHIWQEVRLEGDEYVTKTFWAQMQTAFEVTPDERIAYADKPRQMESGFGVNTNLTTTITTNYDHPEKLVGCQIAWVYAPETGYGQIAQWSGVFDSLESIGGAQGARITRWQQKVNPHSESGSRLHYTPLWFPDGQYTLLCQSFYAWTPAGQMYWYDVGSVDILGDMYDRVTAIQGR